MHLKILYVTFLLLSIAQSILPSGEPNQSFRMKQLPDGRLIRIPISSGEAQSFSEEVNFLANNHRNAAGYYNGTSNSSSEPLRPRSISSNDGSQGSRSETSVSLPSAPSTPHNNAPTSKSYVNIETSMYGVSTGLMAAYCAEKCGATKEQKYASGIVATTGMSAFLKLRSDNNNAFMTKDMAIQLLVDNTLYIAGQALFDYVLGKPKTVSHATSVQPKDNKTAHRTLAEECAG